MPAYHGERVTVSNGNHLAGDGVSPFGVDRQLGDGDDDDRSHCGPVSVLGHLLPFAPHATALSNYFATGIINEPSNPLISIYSK